MIFGDIYLRFESKLLCGLKDKVVELGLIWIVKRFNDLKNLSGLILVILWPLNNDSSSVQLILFFLTPAQTDFSIRLLSLSKYQ
jgi:hypothetical protein